jgi:hypothetical protein
MQRHGKGLYKRRPWREDIVIRDRMAIVQRCWMGGMTIGETIRAVEAETGSRYDQTTIARDRRNLGVLASEYRGRHRPLPSWW